MAKYNRLCVTISDETNMQLDLIIDNANKKIKALSKSAIVELALVKFFETASTESIANELLEQMVVE